jgi:EpsI family protein
MTSFTRRAIILAVLMLGASMLSVALTPTQRIAVEASRIDLEVLIPRQFGDWRVEERVVQAVVNPQTQAYLNTIYSQTLSRTYVNSADRRIMLSLAYGADQSHDNQIHKPEVCYPAQGFQIITKKYDTIHTETLTLPVMRIATQIRNRHEPVTYWIRIGDSLVRGAIEQNLARVSYGLKGYIPDGILFRISEINSDSESSYELQDQFVQSLLLSLTSDARKMLIGEHKPKEAN